MIYLILFYSSLGGMLWSCLKCKLLEIHLLVHVIQIVDNKWKQIPGFQRVILQNFTKILRIEPGTFDVQSICSAPALQSSYIVQHHMIITSKPSAVLRNFIDFPYSFQKLPPRQVFDDYLSKLNFKKTIQWWMWWILYFSPKLEERFEEQPIWSWNFQ